MSSAGLVHAGAAAMSSCVQSKILLCPANNASLQTQLLQDLKDRKQLKNIEWQMKFKPTCENEFYCLGKGYALPPENINNINLHRKQLPTCGQTRGKYIERQIVVSAVGVHVCY